MVLADGMATRRPVARRPVVKPKAKLPVRRPVTTARVTSRTSKPVAPARTGARIVRPTAGVTPSGKYTTRTVTSRIEPGSPAARNAIAARRVTSNTGSRNSSRRAPAAPTRSTRSSGTTRVTSNTGTTATPSLAAKVVAANPVVAPTAPITVSNPNPVAIPQYNVKGQGNANAYGRRRNGGPRSGLSMSPAQLRKIAARRLMN